MENLDFGLIKEELETLITATGNKLKREWTQMYPNELVNGGKFTILNLYRLSIINYSSVLALCKLSEDLNQYLYLATPSINRGILENFFSIIYLLSDFPEHHKLFIKNSLRERQEILDFYQEHFKDNPKWSEYLANTNLEHQNYEKFVDEVVGLTNSEKTNMQNMQRFPRVSKVIEYLERNNHPDIKFFKYLDKYHYIQLSHFSHSQPSGLIVTGNMLENSVESVNIDFLTRQLWTSITLVLSLISEIELHFNYNLESRITYLWGFLKEFSDYAKEAYELRYRKLFFN